MKERYEKAEMEVIELEQSDIVTASLIPCPGSNDTPGIPCVIGD
ncbi:MAG: hypothetical protein Q4C20_12320 [Erysipelotrichaceae bacterium]|nr:hypothetical protein [Erysipelotrichaceae bacterium]